MHGYIVYFYSLSLRYRYQLRNMNQLASKESAIAGNPRRAGHGPAFYCGDFWGGDVYCQLDGTEGVRYT